MELKRQGDHELPPSGQTDRIPDARAGVLSAAKMQKVDEALRFALGLE